MMFGMQHYYKDTPAKLRKLADSIRAPLLSASGASILSGFPKIAVSALLGACLAEAISNMFAEDKKDAPADQPLQ